MRIEVTVISSIESYKPVGGSAAAAVGAGREAEAVAAAGAAGARGPRAGAEPGRGILMGLNIVLDDFANPFNRIGIRYMAKMLDDWIRIALARVK